MTSSDTRRSIQHLPEVTEIRDEATSKLSDASTWRLLVTTIAAAVALRIALLLVHGTQGDIGLFVRWAHRVMQYGTYGLYGHGDTADPGQINYPPVYALILSAVVAVYHWPILQRFDSDALLRLLLKFPAVASDIALCILVFVIAKRWVGARNALVSAALAAFAPSTWPVSAIWGQVDSICSAFMLLSLALVISRKWTIAWGALAVAVLVKPLPIVVAPLLIAAQVRDEGLSPRLFGGPLFGLFIAYVASLPFAPGSGPIAVFGWLAKQYVAGQNLFSMTSVNAYNAWTLVSEPVSDSTVVFGITLQVWGWLAFALCACATILAFLKGIGSERNGALREQLLVRTWFFLLAELFFFASRMHERYILFALALMPLMWFCGRCERLAAVTLTATFVLCVFMLKLYAYVHIPQIAAVTHAISVLNFACVAVLACSFVRNRPAGVVSYS